MLKFTNQFYFALYAIVVFFGLLLCFTKLYQLQKEVATVERMQTMAIPAKAMVVTPTASPSATPTPTKAVKGVYIVPTK